jgi:MFS family permease
MSWQGATQPTQPGGKLSVLRNRNFTLLWIGSLISNSGSWMTLIGQGWLVYDLTGSSWLLGVVGVARAIPMVVFPPMGGVVADRLPRLRLLKFTQTLSCALSFILAMLVLTDVIQVWHIVAFSFTSGLVNAFDQPTRQAMLPDLVRREDLTKAVALNASVWQGAALFGPTLAGLTIAAIGVAGAFFIDALSFMAVVTSLFLMRGVPERSQRGDASRGFTSDLRAGLDYVGRTRLIFLLLLMSTVAGVFGRSFQQFLPAFAEDVYHQGSFGLGLMASAPGAGALVGAAILTLLADSRRKGLIFLCAMFCFGLALVTFSLNTSFTVGIVVLFLVGVLSLLFTSMLTTIIQLEAAPEMRGRVMSLVTVTMQGFSPLGGLFIGALAGPLGTPHALGLAASLCAACAVLALATSPRMRDYTARPADDVPPSAEPRGSKVPVEANG